MPSNNLRTSSFLNIPLALLTLWVSALLSLISQAPSVFSCYLPVLLIPGVTYFVE